MAEDEVRTFGRYIVADPRTCHGKLTLCGTRILVETMLNQVAEGLAWETIAETWGVTSRKRRLPRQSRGRARLSSWRTRKGVPPRWHNCPSLDEPARSGAGTSSSRRCPGRSRAVSGSR